MNSTSLETHTLLSQAQTLPYLCELRVEFVANGWLPSMLTAFSCKVEGATDDTKDLLETVVAL